MSDIKNSLRVKLLENNNKFIAYHGSSSVINSFSDEFVGGKEATDQEGPGVYFTTSKENAIRYGSNVYKVELTPRNPVSTEEGKNAPEKQIEWLIKQAPDWKETAQNFNENPNLGLKIAVRDFIRYNENPHQQFLQVWYDFYRDNPVQYVRNMVKLGYDSIIIEDLRSIFSEENVTHIIVLDLNIIKYLNKEEINLNENLQLADKVYFKDNKLPEEVKKIILKITNGDPFTKIITDIYYFILNETHRTGNWALSQIDKNHDEDSPLTNYILNIDDLKKIKQLYLELKQYNKNVFPIKGFNINGVENVGYFISAIKQRSQIIEILKKLPSVASRSLQKDIRIERTYPELQDYRNDLEYFYGYYGMLGNRDSELKKKIENKIFRSNSSLETWLDFVQEKENLLGGADFNKKEVERIIKDNYYLDKIYSKGNILIVEVSGVEGVKELGCNSLWCFTYPGKNGWNMDWYTYSTNDLVYVIIDFNEKSDSSDFMHVLIKPLKNIEEVDFDDTEDIPLYNMANEVVYNYVGYIEDIIGYNKGRRLMNFGIELPKEKKKREKYVDSNQLALNFENKTNLKNLLKEALMRIDDDVNMIYSKYFEYDIDSLTKKGDSIDNTYFLSTELDTSLLKDPLCVKAHEINPCIILINSKTFPINIYAPSKNIISVGVNKVGIRFIIDEAKGYFEEALKVLRGFGGDDDANKLIRDFSEERVKGTIHRELVHWLDDTLHNGHLNKFLNKRQSNPKILKGNINSSSIEIQAQIHNILQLKNKFSEIWDDMTFMRMIRLSTPLSVVYNMLEGDERNEWIKKLKKRMYREGLLGKNMV